MGFNSVYRFLQEMFPQVDARLLKAVAFEHHKDADVAVDVILTEVIPLMSRRSTSALTHQDQRTGGSFNKQVGGEEKGTLLRHQQVVEETGVGPSSVPECAVDEDTSNELYSSGACSAGSGHLNEPLYTVSNTCDANDGNAESEELKSFENAQENHAGTGLDKVAPQTSNDLMHGAGDGFNYELAWDLCINVSEELKSLENAQENQAETGLDGVANKTSISLIHGAVEDLNCEQACANAEAKIINSPGMSQETEPEKNADMETTSANNDAFDYDVSIYTKCQNAVTSDTAALPVENSLAHPFLHVPGRIRNTHLELEVASGTAISVRENQESGCSFSKQDYSVSETSCVEDEISENNVLSQSDQVCKISLLEEIIEEAKTNKKILFSSMESLINLMRDVDLQENAANQAKMEAAQGGSDILVRVEELKQTLMTEKEANNRHAGEVYGEKAILATEMRELQSRLLSLSDERDKSLAILDEMRHTLEARLAAAEELRKAAEQEKLEKEESARNALAEQETVMEKVVQESMRLKQEAEENSKLREFLMDRGSIVDMLQGEISVICQDVRLLKEKFDAHLPLSKSFTSCQTSCILASSGSSVKSVASGMVIEKGELSELLKNISPPPSIDSLSPKSRLEDESGRVEHKALIDDGWDVFDKDSELDC
ncbi:Ubiquitin system component Cue [Quillaja saponaria]|uniref:Ubiquitin system component Cue n=1 Tax=Quillaja saponaria TaxID=32244 RepID=A0AAD7Q1C0_QUISA|nr:Ubiquitin system component Cue [Quillaja saponaria]KAJ7972826.1 Ubiquitin system component Cue [Quillaja saponaria]